MTEVAIVGFASSSRELANQLPADVEIWGMNQLYRPGFLTRAERWFELHSRTLYETQLDMRRPAGYLQWLRDFGGPVYMIEAHPAVPNSVRYPIEAIAADVGEYLTSTVAYMLALAIHERHSPIHLYGVDMAIKSEYAEQRACCEYLIGLARGRGLTVILPEVCPLVQGPLYGRGALNPGGERITDNQFAARLEALRARHKEIQAEIDERQQLMQRIEGSMMETQYWINVTPEGAHQQVLTEPATKAPDMGWRNQAEWDAVQVVVAGVDGR